MHYIELVGILAAAQVLFFGMMAGRARMRSGLEAPAVTGDPHYERAHRVHMNTLELVVVFLPALFLAGKYWNESWVAALGAVYLVGRMFYWRGYMDANKSRFMGFLMSMLPTVVLVISAISGAVLSILS